MLLMTPPALRATFPAKLGRKRSLTPDPADLLLPRHATMFCLVLLLGYFTCAFKAGLAQIYQRTGALRITCPNASADIPTIGGTLGQPFSRPISQKRMARPRIDPWPGPPTSSAVALVPRDIPGKAGVIASIARVSHHRGHCRNSIARVAGNSPRANLT